MTRAGALVRDVARYQSLCSLHRRSDPPGGCDRIAVMAYLRADSHALVTALWDMQAHNVTLVH